MRSFCRKNIHVHKIPRFFWGGGVFWVLWGEGSADFIFMGARIFLIFILFQKKGQTSATTNVQNGLLFFFFLLI